jgi:cell wall assembly regulator SMI1
VINDIKKLKLTNWSQIIRDRKVWIDLVQNTKTHDGWNVRRSRRGKEEEI